MHVDLVFAQGKGGCVLGALQNPRIKAQLQRCVWTDARLGSNPPWPWPGALTRIKPGPQKESRRLGLSTF